MLLRDNYFGGYELVNSRDPNQIQNYSSVFQTDAMLMWDFNNGKYGLSFGGNNVFDAQPDPAEFGICCGLVVRTETLIDWQGPYHYLTGRVRWN